MTSRATRVTQAEITRVVRGAVAAGIAVAAVQVDGSRIVVLTSLPDAAWRLTEAKDAADVVADRLKG